MNPLVSRLTRQRHATQAATGQTRGHARFYRLKQKRRGAQCAFTPRAPPREHKALRSNLLCCSVVYILVPLQPYASLPGKLYKPLRIWHGWLQVMVGVWNAVGRESQAACYLFNLSSQVSSRPPLLLSNHPYYQRQQPVPSQLFPFFSTTFYSVPFSSLSFV